MVFEFFKKEFEFQGKHAQMVEELCTLNQYERTYFKRAVDIYLLAPIIGFRLNRKAKNDYSLTDKKSIFPEQIIKEKENLEFILQMILILEPDKKPGDKDQVRRTFEGARTKEEFDAWNQIFHDYVRGGVEELYERLVLRTAEQDEVWYDEKAANLMGLLERFCKIS